MRARFSGLLGLTALMTTLLAWIRHRSRMQQATVNLFADMGAQPATLQPGLVPATASTDTTAPTSTITSPTSGSTLQVGNLVTIPAQRSTLAAVWWPGGSFVRWRKHMAPRHWTRELELRLGTRYPWNGDYQAVRSMIAEILKPLERASA